MNPNRNWLLGGAALIAALGTGYGIAQLTDRAGEPAAEAEHDEGEHADAPEGVVVLTAQQITSSGIAVVPVGRGGGAETRIAGRVEAISGAKGAVAASVGGRVERVLVAAGSPVRSTTSA